MLFFEKQITQKILKIKKSRSGKTTFSKTQIGVMVAGVSPVDPDRVLIGFSLCHKNDRYNYVRGIKIPNYDKMLATTRALTWDEGNREVKVPDSIRKTFDKFVQRCQKYYKDKKIVAWPFHTPDKKVPELFPCHCQSVEKRPHSELKSL